LDATKAVVKFLAKKASIIKIPPPETRKKGLKKAQSKQK
jgi:hypothetical protein